MDQLRELGVDVWFNLGDRDLAICLERARMLRDGERQTEAQARIAAALGVAAAVLPMSDQPVRTAVLAAGRWWPLQEFMIRHRGAGPVRRRRVPPRPGGPADGRGAGGDRDARGRS